MICALLPRPGDVTCFAGWAIDPDHNSDSFDRELLRSGLSRARSTPKLRIASSSDSKISNTEDSFVMRNSCSLAGVRCSSLSAPPVAGRRHVLAHEHADADAVETRHVPHVEHDLHAALGHEAVDAVPQWRVPVFEDQSAVELENRHVAHAAFRDAHRVLSRHPPSVEVLDEHDFVPGFVVDELVDERPGHQQAEAAGPEALFLADDGMLAAASRPGLLMAACRSLSMSNPSPGSAMR